jgi:hypothetical protein
VPIEQQKTYKARAGNETYIPSILSADRVDCSTTHKGRVNSTFPQAMAHFTYHSEAESSSLLDRRLQGYHDIVHRNEKAEKWVSCVRPRVSLAGRKKSRPVSRTRYKLLPLMKRGVIKVKPRNRELRCRER